MIPTPRAETGAAGCKPRASGDDPDIIPDNHFSCLVNPARAGMILSAGPSGSKRPCKPRASGDDPFACYPYSAIEL